MSAAGNASIINEQYTPQRSTYGSNHCNAKLDEEQVYLIRLRYLTGAPLKAIAREYGLDKGTTRDAIRGKTWKHVKHPHVQSKEKAA